MKIKEKWVAWEELLAGFTPAFNISFSQVGGMTVGSVPFADSTGHLNEDNVNLFWDAVNFRLGVGLNAPVCRTHIRGAICADYAGVTAETVLLLENTPNVKLHMQAGTAGTAYIDFCDDAFNAPAGRVAYDFANDWLEFGVATTEILRLRAGPTFDYAGTLTLDGIVAITGASINLRNNAEIRFYDNGNYVGFEAPALGANQIWILPDVDGGAGWALVTDGGGNLSFAAVGTGDVTAAAVIADHTIVRGDGGAKGVQDSGVIIDDADNVTGMVTLTLPNEGLHILDTNASHDLIIKAGSDLTADRIFTLMTGDAAKTLTLTGNSTIDNWFDQSVKQGASPTFAGLTVTDYIYFDPTVEHVTCIGYQAGNALVAGGTYNTLIGEQAGLFLATGDYNTLIGYKAGENVTGDRNTAIGFQAGGGNAAGGTPSWSTFIGCGAGQNATNCANSVMVGAYAGGGITTGDNNVCIGYYAGNAIAGGAGNIMIGSAAGYKNTANSQLMLGTNAGHENTGGIGNMCFGDSAGYFNQTGTQNLYIGNSSGKGAVGQSNNYNIGLGGATLQSITTASYNVTIGYAAGTAITSGGNNLFIGFEAGKTQTTEVGNLFIGYQSGKGAGAGNQYNVGIGYKSLTAITSGDYNMAIGYLAGEDLTEGISNIFIGPNAGRNETTGDHNIAIGHNALSLQIGKNDVVAIGYETGYNNSSNALTAIGSRAGKANTSGAYNTFIGYYSGISVNTGAQNCFIGSESGRTFTDQQQSTCIGHASGYTLNAHYATLIGAHAGRNITTGARNTVIGARACYYSKTGQYNTIIGYEAAYGVINNSYSNNVIIGYQAGRAVTIGSNNTVIGYQAGKSITSGIGNVCIGYMAGETNLVAGNNQLWIANTNTATPLIYGEFDNAFIKINNHIYMLERSADPAEPAEGEMVIWLSDGTQKGDDGDVLIASKAGGATTVTTIHDYSAGAAW